MQVEVLLSAADAVGNQLKYSHQGFLANVRMLRMGGLAAIELAQTIRTAVCSHPTQPPADCMPTAAYSTHQIVVEGTMFLCPDYLVTSTVQVAHQRAGMPLRVKDDGASGRSGVSGSHPFGWRDAMDLLVKWRQLAEPNDQARQACIDLGGV